MGTSDYQLALRDKGILELTGMTHSLMDHSMVTTYTKSVQDLNDGIITRKQWETMMQQQYTQHTQHTTDQRFRSSNNNITNNYSFQNNKHKTYINPHSQRSYSAPLNDGEYYPEELGYFSDYHEDDDEEDDSDLDA